ncbi:MAG: carboxypeptidase-like regulatory domain-containing protein [Candidatus Edwardsbacteria bacterium]|nr:carboxypeptidase-like regulatory domain-containing protein [Candidatus Edwardsbacteria bacterium]
MNKIFTFCFIVSVLVLFVASTYSDDTGKITGNVTDAETKELLPGVMIQVLGTTNWTNTDSSGKYVIDNISLEICSLQATMGGYLTKVITKVKSQIVSSKDSIRLDTLPTSKSQGDNTAGFYNIKLQVDPRFVFYDGFFPKKAMIVPDQTQTIHTWDEKEIERMPGN